MISLLAAVVLASAGASGPVRVAFHPLSSADASGEALQQLNAAVWSELRRVPTLALVPEKELAGALKTPCADDTCLLQLGRALKAGEVLSGNVKSHPDSFVLTLRLLDVSTGAELGSAAESVNRDVEEMVRAVRSQVVRLKAPERFAGQLASLAPGAELVVEGRAVGPGPVSLKPATYAVRLRNGKRDAEAWVEVRFDQRALLTFSEDGSALSVAYEAAASAPGVLQLGSGPDQPPSTSVASGWPRWPGWAGVGVGGLLLAVGVLQHVRAGALSSDIDRLRGPDGSFKDPAAAQEVRALSDAYGVTRTSAWILTGAGVVLGAGGAAWLLLAPTPAPASGPPLTGASVAVAGAF